VNNGDKHLYFLKEKRSGFQIDTFPLPIELTKYCGRDKGRGRLPEDMNKRTPMTSSNSIVIKS
jgi:hypothetical protein